MSLFERLQKTISTTLRVPATKITPSTRNDELRAWDSLGQVNLIMALEQTFEIYIEVDDFGELTSVPAIIEYLRAKGVA